MTNLKNSFARVFEKFRYGEQPQPARDWFVLLIFSLLLLAVSASWNAWIFHRVITGGTLSSVSTTTSPVITKASIDAVEKVFADRAAEARRYAAGAYTFTDPSR